MHKVLNDLDPNLIALRMPTHFDLKLSNFHCLKPSVWLNDETINAAMLLLQHVSKDTMVLGTFTKNKFMLDVSSSQLKARSKLAKQLGKHLKKHQVRSTTGLCHKFLIILFSVKCARPSKGACALAHVRSPLGTAGRRTGPDTTKLRCCKVQNTHIDINAHSAYLHEPFL